MATIEPPNSTHVRGSVEAWTKIDKAREILHELSWKSSYVDQAALVSICEDLAREQARLIRLQPEAP